MEYTLKITVSETDDPNAMAARLFISARDDDGHRETAEVWKCSVDVTAKPDHLEPLVWADDLVGQINSKLRHARLQLFALPVEIPMSSLFTH